MVRNSKSKTKSNSRKSYGKRGKKPYDPKFRKDPKGISETGQGEPANDPRYYTNNPVLTALSAAIPVSPVLGANELWHKDMFITGSAIDSTAVWKGDTIPGSMGIGLVPAFGSDMNAGSAGNASFNRLCANLYSMLVRDKSGTAPFDQAAVGHYLVCMRSAYILVHDLQRFLSLVTYYQAGNRYFPRAIAKSIGRDTYSLGAQNLDAAVWEVNKLVRFLNTKFVPKMSVFARDFDLYSRFYTDSDTEYCQYYAFFPRGMYIWDDANNTSEFVNFGTNDTPALPSSLADISAIVTRVIDSMQNSDMFNIINAWMRHVYQPGENWSLAEFLIGQAPVFVYDDYVLGQIENARTIPISYTNMSGFNIVQSGANNFLEYNNVESALGGAASRHLVGITMNPVFNYHVTVPTEDMKIESSRLTVCANLEDWTYDGSLHALTATASNFIFSDQIPTLLLVSFYDSYNKAFYTEPYQTVMNTEVGYDFNGQIVSRLPRISMFKRHPNIWVVKFTRDSGSGKVVSMTMAPLGNIDTVASVDKAAFDRLAYTCTYSLFSVPGVTA